MTFSNDPEFHLKLKIQKMAAFAKIFVFFIIIFCLITSFSQIFSAIIVYLSYGTVVTTSYVTPMNPRLPSLTFCGPKAQFISDQYFQQKFGKQVDRPLSGEDLQQIDSHLSGLLIKEQFDALLSANGLKQLIEWKFRSRVDSDSKNTEYRIALNLDLFCFTLFQELNNTFPFAHFWKSSDDYGLTSDLLITFEVKLKVSELALTIHSSDEPLFDVMRGRYEVVSPEPKKSTNIYIDKTEKRLLSAPYDTNCAPDQTFGNTSRNAYLTECRTSSWLKVGKCWPGFHLTEERSTMMFCPRESNWKDKVEKEQADVLRFCMFRLKTQCFQQYYTMTQNKGIFSSNKSDSHTINVYSSNLSKVILYSPEFTMGQLVAMISNIMSLWLGFIAVYLLIGDRIGSSITRVHSIK